MEEKRIWDSLIPEDLKELYQKVGFGKRMGFGKRPALLLIDMIYNSIGDKPEPVLESLKKYPYSCGEVGWVAVTRIKELLNVAREKESPIIYSVLERESFDKSLAKFKISTAMVQSAEAGTKGSQFIAEVAPQEGDIIVKKKKTSAFFGTPLVTYLTHLQVDTLIIVGCATSSCVQATVSDAYQYNYYTLLPEECIFDRHPLINAVTLFNIDGKFADVVSLEMVKDYLRRL